MGRILIAEDNPKTLEILKKSLQPLGHEIDTARDGEEALKKLQKAAYDLLVTDLVMPGRTGMELLEALTELASKIPILICSAYVTPDAIKGLVRGRRMEIVTKPFKASDLAASARKLLPP